MSTNTKTILTLAGPGAGKTYDLILNVLDYLPKLKGAKSIAIITYTNAATENIQKEIYKEVGSYDKLFIGTIHSFLNKFILLPYSSVFGITPSDIQFIDGYNQKFQQKQQLYAVNKKAREAGVITFDQIENISRKLICGGKFTCSNRNNIMIKSVDTKKIVNLISSRIQAIFVDEYQDATKLQHEIFSSLIKKGGLDYFYCVGDPEQYIYSFRHKNKFEKTPSFATIPILEFKSQKNIQIKKKKKNHRSSQKIVNFLNNFSDIKQSSVAKDVKELDVVFINKIIPQEIISDFVNLAKKFGLDKKKKLYLTYKNDLINWQNLIDIKPISNMNGGGFKLLSESIDYIASVFKMSQKKIKQQKNIDDIDLRKIGIKLIKMIKDNPDIDQATLNKTISLELNLSIPKSGWNSISNLERIKGFFLNKKNQRNGYYSTIHKAKGLQASSVLVIAENIKELNYWIEIEKQKRILDKQDVCRLGYVAFSRAESLLCIACLEQITDVTLKKLENLSVVILPKKQIQKSPEQCSLF